LYSWADEAVTLNPEIGNLNILELMAYAQHYGFPTFFLDWTTNPLIALLFAILDIDDINVQKLHEENSDKDHERTIVIYSFIPEGEVIHISETVEANGGVDINKAPLLYRPPIIDVRIKNQSGVFTYHHSSSLEIRSLYTGKELTTNGTDPYKVLDQFTISPFEALLLRELLTGIGISNYMIMPDLEGLSSYYKNMMRLRSRAGYIPPKKSPGAEYSNQLRPIEIPKEPLA
jgi:hypothetical protein